MVSLFADDGWRVTDTSPIIGKEALLKHFEAVIKVADLENTHKTHAHNAAMLPTIHHSFSVSCGLRAGALTRRPRLPAVLRRASVQHAPAVVTRRFRKPNRSTFARREFAQGRRPLGRTSENPRIRLAPTRWVRRSPNLRKSPTNFERPRDLP
jgi:hypothetical protein